MSNKFSDTKITIYQGINLERICRCLIESESEEEVIDILKKLGFWDNPLNWKMYGNIENNFATIGNQQSLPESAIVEKIINSVDAVLMRECLEKKINPEGSESPETIEKALQQFFTIHEGSLWNISLQKRKELSENICFVATGRKENPCYSIIDKGEGQTPQKMPDTFLSLSKSNKMRIPFVQGKFNMGGTGVLQFSGHQNLQLIISKRDPNISKYEKGDDTKENWGFTVVRREDPKENRKSSVYTYLCIDEKIPNFSAESMNLLPGEYPEPYGSPLKWGTFIKLYEYQIPGGLKTNIVFDLNYRISLLLPKIALPIKFYERRVGYSGHTLDTTMSGLLVRLNEDKRDVLEDGFPNSSPISVSGEQMTCQIYAFKKNKSDKYKKDEGIIFTINGQTHGYISDIFFKRNTVGMSYLSDSLLVVIDCNTISGRSREDLFMNSRDRLRSGELKNQIEKQLERLISDHQGLKSLREKRRRDELSNKIENSKPLKEVLNDLLKKSPALASLLIPGDALKNPFNLKEVGEVTKYMGKEFPTYFKLNLKGIRDCPINSRCRVTYETDASNDYFKRDSIHGNFKLFINEQEIKDYILNLWNGLANLNITLPNNIRVGDMLIYKSITTDPLRLEPFEDMFQIRIIKEYEPTSGNPTTTRPPPSTHEGKDRLAPSSLSLPQVTEIHQSGWAEQGFDKNSALKVKSTGEGGYDFFVNMDNICLHSEIKSKNIDNVGILQEQYKYAMVLIGLALLKEDKKKTDNEEEDVYTKIEEVTSKLSFIVLPMISYLGNLEFIPDQ